MKKLALMASVLAACSGRTTGETGAPNASAIDARAAEDASSDRAAADEPCETPEPPSEAEFQGADARDEVAACSPNPAPSRCMGSAPQFCGPDGQWTDVPTGACPASAACESGVCRCGDPMPSYDSDPENCGACAHSCRGGACSNGHCQPVILVSSTRAPWGGGHWLAVNSHGLYWTTCCDGADVLTVGLDGGTPSTYAPSNFPSAMNDIVANSAGVFWGSFWEGVMTRAPDGTSRVVAKAWRLTRVAFGPTAVCVREFPAPEDPATWCASLSDGRRLLEGLTDDLAAVDATSVYLVKVSVNAVPLSASHTLLKKPFDGSGEIILGQLVTSYVPPIALDDQYAYWADSGTIEKAPLNGGASVMVAAETASSLAVDATHLYWTNATDGTVKRISLAGGAPETLADHQTSPGAIVLDGTSVYWGNQGADASAVDPSVTLMKVAK